MFRVFSQHSTVFILFHSFKTGNTVSETLKLVRYTTTNTVCLGDVLVISRVGGVSKLELYFINKLNTSCLIKIKKISGKSACCLLINVNKWFSYGQYGNAVVSTGASGCEHARWLELYCLVCMFSCVCLDFPWVLRFPPTVQRLAC